MEVPFEHTTSLDEPSVDEILYGRRTELVAAAATMALARAGSGHIDIVTGPPGIGKTRLAREVATLARADRFQVLIGSGREGDAAPAYWPWVGVLQSYLRATGDAGAGEVAFARLLKRACRRESLARTAVDAGADAPDARRAFFNGVCEILAAIATRRPTMVIIENLHWADTNSLHLLQFVVSRLDTLPLALLVTSRDPMPSIVGALVGDERATSLPLRGLNREQATALIHSRAGFAPAAALLDQLIRLTDGNPHFLHEVAKRWRDAAVPTHASVPPPLSPSPLVPTLQQLERLSIPCLALLQTAALIGDEFDGELAANIARIPVEDGMRMLTEAVRANVLIPLGTGYRFSHHIVRETALFRGGFRTFTVCEMHSFAEERAAPDTGGDTRLSPRIAHVPRNPEPSVNSLVRKGDAWLLSFRGESAYIRHLIGISYLAAILKAAGHPVHVLDLVSPGFALMDSSIALGPDAAARREYKDRIRSLEADIDHATELNDLGRVHLLEQEREALIHELSYAYGLYGRSRPTASAAERARVSVKNRLTSGLDVIQDHHPIAHRHFVHSIKTGAFCRYSPELPSDWTIDPGPPSKRAKKR